MQQATGMAISQHPPNTHVRTAGSGFGNDLHAPTEHPAAVTSQVGGGGGPSAGAGGADTDPSPFDNASAPTLDPGFDPSGVPSRLGV